MMVLYRVESALENKEKSDLGAAAWCQVNHRIQGLSLQTKIHSLAVLLPRSNHDPVQSPGRSNERYVDVESDVT